MDRRRRATPARRRACTSLMVTMRSWPDFTARGPRTGAMSSEGRHPAGTRVDGEQDGVGGAELISNAGRGRLGVTPPKPPNAPIHPCAEHWPDIWPLVGSSRQTARRRGARGPQRIPLRTIRSLCDQLLQALCVQSLRRAARHPRQMPPGVSHGRQSQSIVPSENHGIITDE